MLLLTLTFLTLLLVFDVVVGVIFTVSVVVGVVFDAVIDIVFGVVCSFYNLINFMHFLSDNIKFAMSSLFTTRYH